MDSATEPRPDVPFSASYAAFYRREFPAMVALAYAVSGSRLGAEDLAQEALLRAYRDWERISAYDKPGAWVRRVTINLATSALRRRSVEARALLRMGGGAVPLPDPEVEDIAMWAALKKLPAKQRAAVALFYLEDRSTAEIATALDCSEATARVHLHRGRQALRKGMGSPPVREAS
jgi:RNA polymerase sigma-70 factor (ECF subfamily)